MFWNLIKVNLMFCLFAAPAGVLFGLSLFTPLGLIAFVAALAAAYPIGGACAASMFCISKMIRRDPGYLWFDFKRKLKENIRQAAAPGILCAAFLFLQFYLWTYFISADPNIGWILAALIPLLIFGMVAPYIFLQIAYIDLKMQQILKNSLIISFGRAGRSILGALGGGAIWAAFVFLLPDALPFSPLLLVFGFSVSWLLTLLCIWPPVDKQFSISETLRKQREEDDFSSLSSGDERPGEQHGAEDFNSHSPGDEIHGYRQ